MLVIAIAIAVAAPIAFFVAKWAVAKGYEPYLED